MVTKVHLDGENHRRLLVRGRDVPFWAPPTLRNIQASLGIGVGLGSPQQDLTISVSEDFPSNPDVVLSPGDPVDTHLQTPGNIVELQAGSYGDQTLSPADSVYLFCRTAYGAEFSTPSAGVKTFIGSGGNNVTIRGLKVDGYGQTRHQGDGAIRFGSGSTGWQLTDVEVMRAAHAAIEHRGSGHTLLRCKLHDVGQYGWSGGFNGLIKDCEVWRTTVNDGTQLVAPYTNTSDRGVCKMAGSSSGMRIEDLEYWNIQNGKGLWWDGARDGSAKGVIGSDITHNGFSVEVCWGGAENPPDGHTVTWPDPAFVIEDVYIKDQHSVYPTNEFWPAPAGGLVSMSPGVWYDNVEIENAGTAGLGVVYSGSHSVFSRGFTAADPPITPEWCQAELKNHNVRFTNFFLHGTTGRFQAGVSGGFDGSIGTVYAPEFSSGGTPSTQYAMNNDRFRWLGDNQMTLSEWLALGHS